MSCIGIITESKKEIELEQKVKTTLKNLGKKPAIIVINQKSIENIKNVKFELIILETNIFENSNLIKRVLMNSERILVNSDFNSNLEIIHNLKLSVITYGFNSKSTITASSVDDSNGILICLQRSIKNINNKIIEPQEIKIYNQDDKNTHYVDMILLIITLLYS